MEQRSVFTSTKTTPVALLSVLIQEEKWDRLASVVRNEPTWLKWCMDRAIQDMVEDSGSKSSQWQHWFKLHGWTPLWNQHCIENADQIDWKRTMSSYRS